MPVNIEAIGAAFAMASIAAAVASLWRPRRAVVIAVAVVVGCAAIVPVDGLSAASFALAFPGALSAATLVLCARLLHGAVAGGPAATQPSIAFLGGVIVSGLLLYPMTLGLGPFDPYDLGYRGLGLPALMAAIVIAGWLSNARDVPLWIGGAAALFLCGALTSTNLWDYLIDPVAFIWALAALVVRILSRRRSPPVKEATSRS